MGLPSGGCSDVSGLGHTAAKMDAMERSALAAQVDAACRLSGEFLLRSGERSNEYFDKYLFESNPTLLRHVCQAMVPLIPTNHIRLTRRASPRLTGQESNLQSRINSPPVYRLTDRGSNSLQHRHIPELVVLLRLERLADQGHPGFLRRPVALEAVAGLARRHQVEPRVAAAP